MTLVVRPAVTAVAMLGPLLVDMAGAPGVTVPAAGRLVTAASGTRAFPDAHGRRQVFLHPPSCAARARLGAA